MVYIPVSPDSGSGMHADAGRSPAFSSIVLHRLGGAEALELCRDKRLVLVGDSLNRNMWESLACILYAAVPDRSRTRIVDDAGSEYRIFRAMVSSQCLHTNVFLKFVHLGHHGP